MNAILRRPPAADRFRRHQRGAVAIEFAALFVLFFVLLYAILAYSVPLLLTLSFKQVSADAARAAIKVDTSLAPIDYSNIVSREVARVIDASWLPENWRDGNCPPPDGGTAWQPLPAAEGGPSYGYFSIDTSQPEDTRFILHVCLQRKYNHSGPASETAIVPPLQLLIFSVPALPEKNGETILRGQTVIRL